MERFKERGHFIIPILMWDMRAKRPLKAVMLDISSKGIRVFSNDKRLLMIDKTVLQNKVFKLEFDFFDIPTSQLQARVVNISPGEHKKFETRLGLEFVDIPIEIARQIDVFLQERFSS